MECLHTSCCHNSRCFCGCSSVKMSAGEGAAKCSSYKPDASFRNRFNTEIAEDFDNNITCSAENCVFNIHFACNAGRVKVSNGGRCITYNRV